MAVELPTLIDDTVINVAQLLKQPIGAARTAEIRLSKFALDQDLWARDVVAAVRLTRIERGILVDGDISGWAGLVCVRCLDQFEAPFGGTFDAEFWPSVEVRTGVPLPMPEDDEVFLIDHNHELDLSELLRQIALVSLPMRPVCGEDCPGFERDLPADQEAGDARLAVLQALLDEEPD